VEIALLTAALSAEGGNLDFRRKMALAFAVLRTASGGRLCSTLRMTAPAPLQNTQSLAVQGQMALWVT